MGILLTFYGEKRIVRRPKTQSLDLKGQILANIASARKRARTAEKSRQRNVAMRSKLRTFIKSVVKAIDAGNKEEAQQLYTASVPVIDSSARKGIIHTNKAARHKQRLNSRIRAM